MVFDANTGRLTGTEGDRTAAVYSDIIFAYDSAGNQKWQYTDTAKTPRIFDNRRSYYGADGTLRLAEARGLTQSGNDWKEVRIFEEFRYDALGRRVLVRNRQACSGPGRGEDVTGCR